MGILGAAGVVFFAFIGFDAVSTAAQEAKNPKRDMPIGILGSLVVCTMLYVAFSYVLSGVATVAGLPDGRAGKRRSPTRSRTYMHGLRVAGEVRHRGDPGRVLVGHPRDAARPVARVLLDEPRRPGADGLLRTCIRRYKTPWKSNIIFFVFTSLFAAFVPGERRRRDDQHRDAVRVHPGLRRRVDHARPAARRAARLHRARAAGGGGARHRRLRLDDLRPRLDQLGAARRSGWSSGSCSTSATGARTAGWRSRARQR